MVTKRTFLEWVARLHRTLLTNELLKKLIHHYAQLMGIEQITFDVEKIYLLYR